MLLLSVPADLPFEPWPGPYGCRQKHGAWLLPSSFVNKKTLRTAEDSDHWNVTFAMQLKSWSQETGWRNASTHTPQLLWIAVSHLRPFFPELSMPLHAITLYSHPSPAGKFMICALALLCQVCYTPKIVLFLVTSNWQARANNETNNAGSSEDGFAANLFLSSDYMSRLHASTEVLTAFFS